MTTSQDTGAAARALAVALAGALVGGCPDDKEPSPPKHLTIARVEVQDRTPPPRKLAGVTPAIVKRWITGTLKRAPAIQLKPGAPEPAYVLALQLGVGQRRAADGTPRAVALVSARAAIPGALDAVVLQASAAAPLEGEEAGASKQEALQRVVQTLVEDLAYQARLAVMPANELARVLGQEKDVQRLGAAVEIAAVRKARPAVPALIDLLRHDEAEVADRAIGALVAIGDRRAVKALTRLSKFSDTAKMAKILDGIGTLGGKEAREYLEFVASGHPDADIRNLAAEALERMDRREGRAAGEGK